MSYTAATRSRGSPAATSSATRLGAGTGGQGGFAEAVVRVEDDGHAAAEGVEAPRVSGAAVGEVDLLQEHLGAVSCRDPSRPRTTMLREGSRSRAGSGRRALAQDRDDRPKVLQADPLGAIRPQVAGLDNSPHVTVSAPVWSSRMTGA